MRSLTVLGSTGSIGTQALQIAAQYPERFRIAALCAHANSALLFEQVRRFRPGLAGLTGGPVPIPDDLLFCDWHFGPGALESLARHAPAEDVLVSVSGMVGLRGVLAARQAGRRVLLANKEALVAGGALVMAACQAVAGEPSLLPVDSEHSAIYQCLRGAEGNPYDKLILTASGGPFRAWPKQDIRRATLAQALRHPNWAMGRKITVDSASMFNKALEIIEAKWLFHARPDQIEVLVHPQSIVHSMVRFPDGAVLAQLGIPDMRIPILYAMACPERLCSGLEALDLVKAGRLDFEAPDTDRFPAIRLAYQALESGGAAACILNAANEAAAAAFIEEKIPFGAISDIVDETLQRLGSLNADSLQDILAADGAARETAGRLIGAAIG
ncbi:MAG: 1-deoxy-D-xylulose-5-phosphate reductoisomerase [Christensenellales bacterium]